MTSVQDDLFTDYDKEQLRANAQHWLLTADP